MVQLRSDFSTSMAAIGVHFGYTCACVAIFKVLLLPVVMFLVVGLVSVFSYEAIYLGGPERSG